jgi:hypothetical protein
MVVSERRNGENDDFWPGAAQVFPPGRLLFSFHLYLRCIRFNTVPGVLERQRATSSPLCCRGCLSKIGSQQAGERGYGVLGVYTYASSLSRLMVSVRRAATNIVIGAIWVLGFQLFLHGKTCNATDSGVHFGFGMECFGQGREVLGFLHMYDGSHGGRGGNGTGRTTDPSRFYLCCGSLLY